MLTDAFIGVAASFDPVALGKFCLDQVYNLPQDKDNDIQTLPDRISRRHGTRIVFSAEEMRLRLGSTEYVVEAK